MSLQKLTDVVDSKPGYEGKYFYGRVTTKLDLQRVKASLPGLFEGPDYPIMGTLVNSPFGVGKGFGVYGTPEPGSTVIFQLQDGDRNYPIALGQILDQADVDPRFTQNHWGFVDPKGNTLIVDLELGTWEFIHNAGTRYKIDEQGNLDAHVEGTATVNVVGHVNLKAPSVTADIEGAAVVNADTITLNAPTTINGDTLINGDLRVTGITNLGTFTATGGTMIGDWWHIGHYYLEGNMTHTLGRILSHNVVVHTHTHNETGSVTEPPNPD